MSQENKKSALEAPSRESVQTEADEVQEQPTTTPDGSTGGNAQSAVRATESLTVFPTYIARVAQW